MKNWVRESISMLLEVMFLQRYGSTKTRAMVIIDLVLDLVSRCARKKLNQSANAIPEEGVYNCLNFLLPNIPKGSRSRRIKSSLRGSLLKEEPKSTNLRWKREQGCLHHCTLHVRAFITSTLISFNF